MILVGKNRRLPIAVVVVCGLLLIIFVTLGWQDIFYDTTTEESKPSSDKPERERTSPPVSIKPANINPALMFLNSSIKALMLNRRISIIIFTCIVLVVIFLVMTMQKSQATFDEEPSPSPGDVTHEDLPQDNSTWRFNLGKSVIIAVICVFIFIVLVVRFFYQAKQVQAMYESSQKPVLGTVDVWENLSFPQFKDRNDLIRAIISNATLLSRTAKTIQPPDYKDTVPFVKILRRKSKTNFKTKQHDAQDPINLYMIKDYPDVSLFFEVEGDITSLPKSLKNNATYYLYSSAQYNSIKDLLDKSSTTNLQKCYVDLNGLGNVLSNLLPPKVHHS